MGKTERELYEGQMGDEGIVKGKEKGEKMRDRWKRLDERKIERK